MDGIRLIMDDYGYFDSNDDFFNTLSDYDPVLVINSFSADDSDLIIPFVIWLYHNRDIKLLIDTSERLGYSSESDKFDDAMSQIVNDLLINGNDPTDALRVMEAGMEDRRVSFANAVVPNGSNDLIYKYLRMEHSLLMETSYDPLGDALVDYLHTAALKAPYKLPFLERVINEISTFEGLVSLYLESVLLGAISSSLPRLESTIILHPCY